MNKLPWQQLDNTPETRRKFSIFALCLVFSFLAWLSIKMFRESAATIPVKITISNIPRDLIFSHQADTTFMVNVQSTGMKLLASRFNRRAEIMEADFSSLQKMTRNNNTLYYLTASQAATRFSLKTEIPRRAISVLPDTIFFSAEEAFYRKVPVILDKELEFRPGFKTYDIALVEPDSVYAYGPLHLRDSVTAIHTRTLKASAADQHINTSVELHNPYYQQQISLSHSRVDVHIPVEEFTEAMVELPLHIDCNANAPSGNSDEGDLLLFPDKVSVYYLVALRDDKAISPEMFRVAVNCPDTIGTAGFRLKAEVKEKPGLVEIIRIRPAEVEYVWIKK